MPKSPWVPSLDGKKKSSKARCPNMVEGDKRCLYFKGHKNKCDNPLDFGDGSEITFPKMSWMEMKLIDMKTPQKMIDTLTDALFLVRKKIEM